MSSGSAGALCTDWKILSLGCEVEPERSGGSTEPLNLYTYTQPLSCTRGFAFVQEQRSCLVGHVSDRVRSSVGRSLRSLPPSSLTSVRVPLFRDGDMITV